MKVPKGRSFTIGQRTYIEGETIPEGLIHLVPKSWTEGKKTEEKKADKLKK